MKIQIKTLLIWTILLSVFFWNIGFVIGLQSNKKYNTEKEFMQFINDTIPNWQFYFEEWKKNKENK